MFYRLLTNWEEWRILTWKGAIPFQNPFQTPPELLCRSYDFGAFCPQFSQCTLRELKVLQELTLPQNFQPYPCRSHATRKGKGKQSLIHTLSFLFHVSWPDFPQKWNAIKSETCLAELDQRRRLHRASCCKRNASFCSTPGCFCGTLINWVKAF